MTTGRFFFLGPIWISSVAIAIFTQPAPRGRLELLSLLITTTKSPISLLQQAPRRLPSIVWHPCNHLGFLIVALEPCNWKPSDLFEEK
jgi:hypothetical protein